MAVGKNKRSGKGRKGRKKAIDPFLKKEWYKLTAPSMFANKDCGKTIVTKTQGTKIASDNLKGRVIEVSSSRSSKNEELAYRKIKLCIEDVQGFNCLLNFHGMDMTRDKTCSMIKKHQSIIEAYCDAKTTDGYIVRLFCIAFTKKGEGQTKKTCYANTSQSRNIRAKMVEYMSALGSKGDLKSMVHTLITADCGGDIEKECWSVFPIQDCYIRKVKVLKKPKFDVTALMEWHNDDSPAADVGKAIEPSAENAEPEDTLVAGSGGRL